MHLRGLVIKATISNLKLVSKHMLSYTGTIMMIEGLERMRERRLGVRLYKKKYNDTKFWQT